MSAALISGRYELGDRLGSGGMSSVYKATDRVLERTVAVKILAEHLSDDEKFVARFRREALAVAKLIHPNIVQVYDTGRRRGPPLHRHGVRGGPLGRPAPADAGALGPEAAVEIGVQSCAGLDYAHRQGIIHRDVKPGNLMVIGGPAATRDSEASAHDPPTGEMTVKLTDFGIARAAEQTRLTQVGSVVGTAAYLSPEQARGEEADAGVRRLRARRRHLPALDRAPALGGRDARRARDAPRERAAPAAHLLRPRRCPRPSRPRCCARSRAIRRCATRPPASSPAALRPGAPATSPRSTAAAPTTQATRMLPRRADRRHAAAARPSRPRRPAHPARPRARRRRPGPPTAGRGARSPGASAARSASCW